MCCFKTLIAVRPAMRGSFASATAITTTGNKCAATPKVRPLKSGSNGLRKHYGGKRETVYEVAYST